MTPPTPQQARVLSTARAMYLAADGVPPTQRNGHRLGRRSIRSKYSRTIFSTMYESVRSSSRAAATSRSSSFGSIRAAIGAFFSDWGKLFRGIHERVATETTLWIMLTRYTALTMYTCTATLSTDHPVIAGVTPAAGL
jgi:hypothetical protein